MAYCRHQGKDRITLVTREDRETPSNAELVADDPSDPYEEHGPILPNRDDINCNCPCLRGWPAARVGEQFKVAFSCFHCSTEDVKGSDCVDHSGPCRSACRSTRTSIPRKRRSQRMDQRFPEAIATKEEGSS